MRAPRLRLALPVCGMAITLLSLTLTAQADTAGAVDCLPTNLISRTKVIDDQTILFKTRGKQWYENRLPHKCPGLKSAGKFLYKTSIAQLCKVDTITVLQDAGGLAKGATCGLGMFTPTDDPAKKPKTD
jgi:hypothetical protein